MNRAIRNLALLLGCPLVAITSGCSSQNNSAWPLYMQLLREGFHGGFGNGKLTREQAAAVPYASLGFSIDGGHEALLVLATDENNEQMWTSASHIVLNFRAGRLIRTVGLPHDSASRGAGADAPPLSQALKGAFRSARLVDLPDQGAYSVSLLCTTTAARGIQTVSILGTALATRRVDESCRASNPRWSFINNYWIDSQTGFIWRSIQHPHPALTIETEILRPPG